eukprot:1157517-Pelagomonas_calceolata.AAC.7
MRAASCFFGLLQARSVLQLFLPAVPQPLRLGCRRRWEYTAGALLPPAAAAAASRGRHRVGARWGPNL